MHHDLAKKKSMVLDLGSARAAGIARVTFFSFLDGMVRTIPKKIKIKNMARARAPDSKIGPTPTHIQPPAPLMSQGEPGVEGRSGGRLALG